MPTETTDTLNNGRKQAPERLACLVDVAGTINSSLELNDVLDRILGQARFILSAESGSIMLVAENGRELKVLAAQGPRAQEIYGRTQRLGDGVAGWVAEHGTPLLIHGTAADPRFHPVTVRNDIRDALCVPLRVDRDVLGVLCVNNHLQGASFQEEDLSLLTALAHQAALAVRNASAYQQMRRHRATVERLLREVTRAQEEERRRISLEIHDGPAQTMYAALRGVEAARALAAHDPARVTQELDTLERTIRRAIDETRAVMIGLRPPCLDDMGLLCALRSYCRQLEQRSGLRVRVLNEGSGQRLCSARESALFRIAQEALTNVWKHASARQVEVRLTVTPETCSLAVSDDGRGFDPAVAEARASQHLGMSSLRDRAELLGGHLEVISAPGHGTTVRVTAPAAESETGGLP